MAAKAKKAAKVAEAPRAEPITPEEFERLRQEMAATVLYRIKQQRKRLILVEEFFGNLALRLTLKEDWTCKTMWVDGVYLGYNPAFVIGLTDAEIKGVLAHEVLHVACGHCWRRGSRDQELWNEACDYAINHIVLEAGFVLPKGALYEKEFAGKSAETIYDILERRRQTQPQQPKPNSQESGNGQQANNSSGQQGDSKDPQDPQSSGNKPESGSASKQPQAAEKGQGGDPQQSKDDGRGGQTGADAKPQGSKDAKGNGQGGKPNSKSGSKGSQGSNEGDSGAPAGASTGVGQSPGGSPAGAGQPRPYTPGDVRTPSGGMRVQDIQAEWEIAVKQAQAVARRRGTMPGRWKELLDEACLPNIDWRQVLRLFMQQVWTPFDFTFRRPNARFLGTGFYLPSYYNEAIPCVVGAWDTSGSVWTRLLAMFQAEFGSILEELKPQEAWLMQGDTRVTHEKLYVPGDDLNFGPILGRGGTDWQPFFDRIEEQGWNPTCMVMFTDLECTFPREPDYPVLWVTPPTKIVPPWGLHVQMYD